MTVAPAIISGASAVGGLLSSSSQARRQKEAINEQVRAAETTRILNRMELASQRQTIELNNDRQAALMAGQQAAALLSNDLETQQAQLQQQQAGIEQDRQQVLDTQRVFQRRVAANQQAAQVFRQASQQQSKYENDTAQAVTQEGQREASMSTSATSGGLSSELASERLVMAIQNGQIELDSLMNGDVQQELQQLGYEYDVADIEKRLSQSGYDYQKRDAGRVDELSSIQSKLNRENIGTQSQRNKAALAYELATSRTALEQAAVTNEASSNAQVSSLQTQKKAVSGASVFDWAATIGNIGLGLYAANPNNQAKRPQNNNQYVLSNSKVATDNSGVAPSYIPGLPTVAAVDNSGVAPSYIPAQQLDFTPTETVFNRPRSSYGYANRTARSIFGRR